MKLYSSSIRRHIVAAAILSVFASAAQADQVMKPYFEFKKPKMVTIPGDLSLDTNGASSVVVNATGPYRLGFEGISQYDGASFNRNFIPPDTMGAVGKTQYMSTTNGAYAVFDKTTGNRTALMSDVTFWANAGQTGTNGDTRIMYNATADRWIAVAFGANTKDLQIAVSDTSNALGSWKSTKFEGYAGLGFGATADYPTLALDRNAVYIGTNNFAPASNGGTNSFRGTTMNVIPIDSLFGASGPSTTNMQQIVTPYNGSGLDRGFAPQGVNSNSASSTGRVFGASIYNYDNISYTINGLSSSSATGATVSASEQIGMAAFTTAGAARQPSVALPANRRVVDTGDERISSSVYEVGGRIYMVNTVNTTSDGLDEARVRYTVVDAATNAIIDQGDIGSAGHDYYMGSIAVNSSGQVVVGFNRSGLDPADGKIAFMAHTFSTDATGHLISTSSDIMLKESLVDDYHNGSLFGQAASGRQRWGDYSQVSIDPTDDSQFYLIGEFAREYNNAAGGHPGGTGGSRWGTWIAMIDVSPVPEPSSWAMLFVGLGMVGVLARRRRNAATGSPC
ncbi:PEPxxWA-CTERM sorting domain-containing protein [Pseudoduganella danionis]|uniref:PEPxxWA-CTERM sorting domain-containing protein n=1 Tax=Pseudoduganella danionis TaxID=1890295 RepID=UPI0035B43CE2